MLLLANSLPLDERWLSNKELWRARVLVGCGPQHDPSGVYFNVRAGHATRLRGRSNCTRASSIARETGADTARSFSTAYTIEADVPESSAASLTRSEPRRSYDRFLVRFRADLSR
jgi:hypothetical protein